MKKRSGVLREIRIARGKRQRARQAAGDFFGERGTGKRAVARFVAQCGGGNLVRQLAAALLEAFAEPNERRRAAELLEELAQSRNRGRGEKKLRRVASTCTLASRLIGVAVTPPLGAQVKVGS